MALPFLFVFSVITNSEITPEAVIVFDKFKPYFPKREWDFILLAVVREFTLDGERLIVAREAKKIYTQDFLKRMEKIWTNLGRRFNRIKRSFHDALK